MQVKSYKAGSHGTVEFDTAVFGEKVLFRTLKVSGSKSRAMKLEPLLHACQSVYPDIADERLAT